MKFKHVIDSIQGYVEDCFQQPSMQLQHLSGAGATYYLEEKIRLFYNKKYAIVFSNATTALQALCISMKLKNAEILTSPINWGGSIAPFLLFKNKVRFTSFDTDSLNLDTNDLALASTKKTKAVLSVDYNGVPVDSKSIKSYCADNNLLYISDSSQSFGSYVNNVPSGYYADAIVLSFSPGKSFFAGEGGAILTDDTSLYEKLIWYSQHPSRQKAVFGLNNYNEFAPVNGRMSPLSAILLNETFKGSISTLREYQLICFQLISRLLALKLIEETPHILDPSSSTYYNIVLRLTSISTLDMINDFLIHEKFPFFAEHYNLRVIPFDKSFCNQFKHQYSKSDALIEQCRKHKSFQMIKLNKQMVSR